VLLFNAPFGLPVPNLFPFSNAISCFSMLF
jgi:hypothetical protein